jgi:hypothetical protein
MAGKRFEARSVVKCSMVGLLCAALGVLISRKFSLLISCGGLAFVLRGCGISLYFLWGYIFLPEILAGNLKFA